VSCFPAFKPSQEEFNTCDRYELTFETPEYAPSARTFRDQEAGMTDSWGKLKFSGGLHPKQRQICSLHQKEFEIKQLTVKYSNTFARLRDLSAVLDDSTLLVELNCHDNTPYLNASSVNSKMRYKGGGAATLANNWGIGIEAAKRTRSVTTQRGIRPMFHSILTKRYRTNDRQLRYRRLPVTMFTYTMHSIILSRKGNKVAQVFCTDFGFVRAFLMKLESEAHGALSLLFLRDGVPNVMVMDGDNAQTEGEFRRKLCDTLLHIKQTEPHRVIQHG
jgi:hypothetical protein